MAVSDLTGYTWVGKDSGYLDAEGRLDATALLNFTCSGETYSSIVFRRVTDPQEDVQLCYNTSEAATMVYSFDVSKAWSDDKYKTIKITGGEHVQEASIINWLENNGTLIAPSINTLKIGTNSVNKLYLGSTEVDKVCLGSAVVYQK